MSIESFLRTITRWAEADSRIAGLILVGSHANGAARQDSDVDLILLCRTPEDLISDTSWIEVFGAVLCARQEDYGRVTSVRVQYGDGLEVEFGITDPEWASCPLDPGTRHVLIGGTRLLYDSTGFIRRALGSLSEPS